MAGGCRPTIGAARDYDAVVVGARAAGAATAMLLARAGRRVLLVDRGSHGVDTLSTHALMRGGVLQLQRWGLVDAIRAAGTPPIRRTKFHYAERVVDLEVGERHGVDALYAPRRTVLDPILVDAARAAGAEVVYGAPVTALRSSGGRVNGVVAQVGSCRDAVADAAIVIGADGIGSTVARLVGATSSYSGAGASALVYGYFAGLPDDLYDWYFRPGVAAGVIPTNGGVANVFVAMPPARFAAAARADGIAAVLRQVLSEAAPEIAAALERGAPVGRLRSFAGRPGHLRRAHGPGWALVGDAGYYKDPITAHGITDALRDAELLARSLLTAGDAAAYEATRDLLARPFLETTSALASYEWDMHEVAALNRALKVSTDEELAVLAALDPCSVGRPAEAPAARVSQVVTT